MSAYVCVVGAVNLDICGRPEKKLIFRDSNPGAVTLTPGGVAVGDRSGGRFHASRKHVQERTFARPGFAHDAEHFAGPEVEGDVTAADMLPVTAGQVPGRQDGGGVPVFHCAPPCPSRSAARRAQQSVSEHTNMRFP